VQAPLRRWSQAGSVGKNIGDTMTDQLEQTLGAAMAQHTGATGVENLARLTGGASQEMYSFTAHLPDGPQQLIVRRIPGGGNEELSQTAIPKAHEAALLQAAHKAGVPVPQVICVFDAKDGLGAGYVMNRLEGETIARKILRDDAYSKARAVLAGQCGEAMARIHAIPTDGLPPLAHHDALTQLKSLRDLYDGFDDPHPVFELAFRFLADNAPTIDALRLVHGDFRNGNIMVDGEGLVAVLDWELSHFGDPMEDLGWICVNSWRFGQLDHPVGGFGSYDQLFEAYERESGTKVDPKRVHYWEVFGTLRWGIICQIQTFAHLTGAYRSVERAAIGRRASEAELDLLTLIGG